MSEKSHVSMEQHLCPMCGKVHDSGAILLDRRLKKSMERKTLTGLSPCTECQGHLDDGYVALVETDPDRSSTNQFGKMDQQDAHRTGRMVWMRKEAMANVFTGLDEVKSMAFIDPDVYDWLEGQMKLVEGDAQ